MIRSVRNSNSNFKTITSNMHLHSGRDGQKPRHIGTNILPNFSIFNRLLYLAGNRDHIAINDATCGLQATHRQLLSDVLHLRNALLGQLGPDIQTRIFSGQEVAINLLASGGYEFATGFLAIIALGAVVVPICELR